MFDAVAAISRRGGTALVHDPMYTDSELTQLGFVPYHLGEPVDAAVVQADHAEYKVLTPSDLPGVRAFIDGRRVSSAEKWEGVTYRVIGKA